MKNTGSRLSTTKQYPVTFCASGYEALNWIMWGLPALDHDSIVPSEYLGIREPEEMQNNLDPDLTDKIKKYLSL